MVGAVHIMVEGVALWLLIMRRNLEMTLRF
jgi:hypothetical protein